MKNTNSFQELFSLGQAKWTLVTPKLFLSPSSNVKISFWTSATYIAFSSYLVDDREAHAIGSITFALLLVFNHYSISNRNTSNFCFKDIKSE
jgi:hypothetical protein